MKKIDLVQNKILDALKGTKITEVQARNIMLSIAFDIQKDLTPDLEIEALNQVLQELALIRNMEAWKQ